MSTASIRVASNNCVAMAATSSVGAGKEYFAVDDMKVQLFEEDNDFYKFLRCGTTSMTTTECLSNGWMIGITTM